MNRTKNMIPQLSEQNTKEEIFKILNLSVPVLLGIFIFLNPFPHTTAIKEICFYLSVFIVLLLIYFKKIDFSFKSPLTLPFGLFVIWAFIGLFFALDKGNSIHDFRAHLLKYLVFYYILINVFNSRKRLIGPSWIIIISTAIFSAGALYYYYHTLEHSTVSRFGVIYGAKGFTETQNVNIGLLCIWAAIFALHNIFSTSRLCHKTILIVCLFPLMASIVLTQNRCFIVALILSVSFLCLKKKKILIVLLVVIGIVIATTPIKNRVKYDMFADSVRLGIYYRCLEIIKDYPVFGIGYGHQTFEKHLDLNYYNSKIPDKYKLNDLYPAPHNILLDIATRTGLIGLAFYLYIIFAFSKMCWKCIQNKKNNFIRSWGYCIGASFISYLIIGCLQPLIGHMPEVMLFTLFSMMTILWRITERPDFFETA